MTSVDPSVADIALLVLRVVFGVFFALHGINKLKSLAGTGRWFGSIGMKWPTFQARAAAFTEVGGGLGLALGLLTPLPAAGMIGVMVVATWVAHRKNGFFIVNEGWEYTASVALVAAFVATVGPGRWSLDHALDISLHTGLDGWSGALIAAGLGLASGILLLVVSYRPDRSS
ncbi:MAG: DoxX family protein [Ilumatobacteraceae bacterium]